MDNKYLGRILADTHTYRDQNTNRLVNQGSEICNYREVQLVERIYDNIPEELFDDFAELLTIQYDVTFDE